MLCAGNIAPVRQGLAAVEFCYEHFELPGSTGSRARPAWALHALGLADEMTAAFALVPSDGRQPAQWFTARWGRAGVGSNSFMPVPAQIEDDRPGIQVHGFKSSNFNWHNCQWEIAELVEPHAFDLPSAEGDCLDLPGNAPGAWAFRNGAPLVSIDDLAFGEHADFELDKQPDEANHGASYQVRFGGRIWRRWLGDRPPGAGSPLELLAFDTASPVLQQALDHVWADIGGQDDAKRELIRAIQWPVLYPELFLLFKRKRSRGVLLYGPPGCGKTLLGKAVVRLLAALYHRKADDGGFKYVKGHQMLDQYLGNSEKAVKSLFDEARRWREQRGYPAVLFFDEADALFKRRASGAGAESGFTLVPALLAEMDGMDDSGAFVILATNRPDSLDIAITRPGRIDRRIRITRPDHSAAETIFRIHLEGVFLQEGLTASSLSTFAAGELFDPGHLLYHLQFEGADSREQPFLLKDLASGALIQNIVDRATANKMEYCIEQGVKAGLMREDLRQAVIETLAEQRQSRHSEELEEFAERAGRRLDGIRKILPQ